MYTETIPMQGSVRGVMVTGNTVQIWVASPTGDSTDSLIFDIPASSHAHAVSIGNMWRKVWNLPGVLAERNF